MSKKSKKNKIGRNDPCHCGSGKKYKYCHYEIDHNSEEPIIVPRKKEGGKDMTEHVMGLYGQKVPKLPKP